MLSLCMNRFRLGNVRFDKDSKYNILQNFSLFVSIYLVSSLGSLSGCLYGSFKNSFHVTVKQPSPYWYSYLNSDKVI